MKIIKDKKHLEKIILLVELKKDNLLAKKSDVPNFDFLYFNDDAIYL